jgi:hypothetical protein
MGSFFHELPTLGGSSFPWRSVWIVKVHLCVSFFFFFLDSSS